MSEPPLVLASGSPRRARLLEQLGLAFDVIPAAVDEAVLPGEEAAGHVRRLALEKARTVARQRPEALVVAGDTVVALDGDILGQPADPAAAVAMLLRLQGTEHRVESGVAIVAPGPAGGRREAVAVVGADVRFTAYDEALAEAYVATREPLDKAGAYGIQGLGAVLVESIRGDYFAVVGLPVARMVKLVEDVGYRYRFGRGIRPADQVV